MTPRGAWLQTSAPLVSPIDPRSPLSFSHARVRTHQGTGVDFWKWGELSGAEEPTLLMSLTGDARGLSAWLSLHRV